MELILLIAGTSLSLILLTLFIVYRYYDLHRGHTILKVRIIDPYGGTFRLRIRNNNSSQQVLLKRIILSLNGEEITADSDNIWMKPIAGGLSGDFEVFFQNRRIGDIYAQNRGTIDCTFTTLDTRDKKSTVRFDYGEGLVYNFEDWVD